MADDRPSLSIRIALYVAAAAGLYAATWRLLVAFGKESWLAPIWVIQTYLLLGVAYYMRTREATQRVERRKLPRVPVAMPMRYVTEEGQVGVGVLVDVHHDGAGLLIPSLPFVSDRLWLQSAWVDDRIGMQGRVVFTRETPEGLRVGLKFQALHPETVEMISNVLIPLGRHGRKPASMPISARLRQWLGFEHEAPSQPTRYCLPVRVEQGTTRLWAITEEMDKQGAVLMLPKPLIEGLPLRIAVWGRRETYACRITNSELIKAPRLTMYRIALQYAEPGLQPQQVRTIAGEYDEPSRRFRQDPA